MKRAVGMTGLALLLLLLAAPARAQVADDYQNAGTVGLNGPQLSINTIGATVQSGEPITAGSSLGCEDPFGNHMSATVWLRFLGDGGRVTISTAGSDFDTLLAAYAGQPPSIANIDQCSDNLGPFAHSGLVIRTRPGTGYLLQIGGCDASLQGAVCAAGFQGNLRVTIFSAPPNDTRANAETVQSGVPVNRVNRGATIDVPGEVVNCGGASYAKTIWFRWTTSVPGTATFSAGGEPNTVLGLYAAGAAQPLACNDDQSAQERASRVVRYVTPGTYELQVGGFYAAGQNSQSASDGSIALQVDFAPDTDLDDDGYPVPADCNDASQAINPGARDVPRNGVDEDCSGQDAPYPRVNARIFGFFTPFASGVTQIDRLYAQRLPARSRVRLRCRGDGCPPARMLKPRRVKRKKSRLDLDGALRGRRLGPEAKLAVRITKRGRVGVTTSWAMRARRVPKRVDRCLRPGGKRPLRCSRV